MLWGDYPWGAPPPKFGKLYSMGAVARNVSRALGMFGRVVPYVPRPADATVDAQRAYLAEFLRSIDVLWADVYPASRPALELRHEMDLACPAILFAGGAMPKGAEALLFPWQELLRPGDGLLFTCEADRAIWRRLVRSSRLHEWVIPLAVDQTTFRPRTTEERRRTREKHGLPSDAPVLLYVGRLNLQKNLHSLLRLVALVRSEAPDVHLCVVGEEDDIGLHEFGALNTGYVEWLRGLAEDLGLTASISYLGTLFGEDLAQVYAAADVVVNASFYHRENFGLAQAEGQACGTPVVCTSWGGFKDVVLGGWVTGPLDRAAAGCWVG
jgi:glycosyltransferase involved in cell wall biosynthesis